MQIRDQVEAVVVAYPFGKPSAAKRGKSPLRPYVPVIDYGEQSVGVYRTKTRQIFGRAYATRDEAVRCAECMIEKRRVNMRTKLLDPRYRAFRKQYGLPEKI